MSITRSAYSGHQLAYGELVMAGFRAPPVGLEEGGGGAVALLFAEGEESAMIRVSRVGGVGEKESEGVCCVISRIGG